MEPIMTSHQYAYPKVTQTVVAPTPYAIGSVRLTPLPAAAR
jgi:hypothetical protein